MTELRIGFVTAINKSTHFFFFYIKDKGHITILSWEVEEHILWASHQPCISKVSSSTTLENIMLRDSWVKNLRCEICLKRKYLSQASIPDPFFSVTRNKFRWISLVLSLQKKWRVSEYLWRVEVKFSVSDSLFTWRESVELIL